jgi:hypothetical protein
MPSVRIRLAIACTMLIALTHVGCPTANTITFEQEVAAQLADNAAAVYRFTSPALGNNASVRASFRVEDDAPVSGNPGSYVLELYQGTTLLASAGPAAPGEPTVLRDLDFSTGYAAGTAFDLKVIEVSGPTPRAFRLKMGPRYSTPATASLGATHSASVAAGEQETFALVVSAANAGEIDFFLREPGSIAGSNRLTLLDTDHVTVKGRVTGNASVGLDNSEVTGLALADSGASSYLVIVNNNDAAVAGNYDLLVGPAPAADQPAPCEDVTAPLFGTPTSLTGKQLVPEADRDCYRFSLTHGLTELAFTLDETTSSTPGSNEVRVSRDGELVTSKTAATDVNGKAQVDAEGAATYTVVVNNLADGKPNYGLTLSLLGACVGTSCVVYPSSAAELRFDLEPSPVVREIRGDAIGNDLPLDAIAAFQYDKTSAGTFDLRIIGDTGAGNVFLCGTPVSGTQDLLVESCDLTTVDGEPFAEVRRQSGAGTTGILRMGPNLRPRTVSPPPISGGVLVTDALQEFGDVRIYAFTVNAPGPREVGIGFDETGIGKGDNVVTICELADVVDCLTNPAYVPDLRFAGPADGGQEAISLAAGDYALIVDNDGIGFGDYKACVGPVNGDDPVWAPVHLDHDLGVDTAGTGGFLGCGDTDRFLLTTAVTQPVELAAVEPDGNPGSIVIRLEREQLPNGSGAWEVLAQGNPGKSTSRVTVTLEAPRSYRVFVDNTSTGASTSGVNISDPAF